METQELKKAKEAYAKADSKTKSTIKSIFGTEHFILNELALPETFEQAHELFLKKEFNDEINTSLKKRKLDELSSLDKLLIIAEALRGEWEPDYTNENQYKWIPWFERTASGWVFLVTGYEFTHSIAAVGPRFAQESKEKATYFAKKFMQLHLSVLK